MTATPQGHVAVLLALAEEITRLPGDAGATYRRDWAARIRAACAALQAPGEAVACRWVHPDGDSGDWSNIENLTPEYRAGWESEGATFEYAYAAPPAARVPEGWVPISERLPEMGEPVVLIDMRRRENTAGDLIRQVQDCGYLCDFGSVFWSIRGGRGQSLDAYTHWLAAPPPTVAGEG